MEPIILAISVEMVCFPISPRHHHHISRPRSRIKFIFVSQCYLSHDHLPSVTRMYVCVCAHACVCTYTHIHTLTHSHTPFCYAGTGKSRIPNSDSLAARCEKRNGFYTSTVCSGNTARQPPGYSAVVPCVSAGSSRRSYSADEDHGTTAIRMVLPDPPARPWF